MPGPVRHFCLHRTGELCHLDTLCCKGLISGVLSREGEVRNDSGALAACGLNVVREGSLSQSCSAQAQARV